jgi:hypothetical protein
MPGVVMGPPRTKPLNCEVNSEQQVSEGRAKEGQVKGPGQKLEDTILWPERKHVNAKCVSLPFKSKFCHIF